ncbi:MAG: sulfur oxidation c-type cytochrome SoxA [Steroidobacteraceae bacterium]
MNPLVVGNLAGAGLCLLVCAGSWAADSTASAAPRSGYSYLREETRRLQDDDFANPGMLWVQKGEELWSQGAGAAAQSCQSCHGQARDSMRTVATRYPLYSPALGRVINLEQQINRCRVTQLKSSALAYESEDLLALTAFISHQAKSQPVNVSIEGPAAASFARGRAFFYRRRGQLNLACANCHERYAGYRLHGETISQGQINGFPIYRELWQTMGSTHRMFVWCNEAVRAEPYPLGSQEYVDLELFERWRARGLAIETPAVRR